jgi:hypothetical protein
MRELVLEGRECNVCGARVRGVYESAESNVEARGVKAAVSVVEFYGERVRRATRERSGLAHAAGFAGVLYLFSYSLAPLALSRWWAASASDALLFLALNLFAPLALVSAFAAGVSLDRSRGKAGALPALFGLVVGLLGTINILLVFAPWVRFLKAF